MTYPFHTGVQNVMGAGVRDYRRLRVWQTSRALALDVYRLTQTFPSVERFGLTAQMRRSAVSIPSNIAEGAGRDGRAFRQFLQYAAGSASELETQLDIARELEFGPELAISNALRDANAIRNMLWGLISNRSDN